VLVINSGEHSDEHARDLTAPIPEGADAEVLEARRIQLLESAGRLASMRRLSDAYRREMDRAVGGTPAPKGPSRIGTIRQRGATIASMFGAERPVYATPAENIRATQAVTDELDKYDGDEHRHMTERVQQLLDAAAAQHEAGCRAEAPARQNNEPPLAKIMGRHPGRRLVAPAEERATSRLPAAAGPASPSSETRTAAHMRGSGEATSRRLRLTERGTPLRLLSRT